MPARAQTLYLQARRLLSTYRPVQAERLLLRALAELENDPAAGGGTVSKERVLLTMAYVRAELGAGADALQMLDRLEADAPADGELRGLVAIQRGLILWRAGRLSEAVPQLDAAALGLRDEESELYPLLLNRGALQLMLGQVRGARSDYERCARLAASTGDEVRAVKAGVSLAYLDFVAGDLPRALAGLDALLERAAAAGTGIVAETRLIRAEALLSAGLLAEADAELTAAAAGFASVRMVRDRAQCDLTRAWVALLADRRADAVRLARAARRRFAGRGSPVWELLAELVELQARLPGSRAPRELAERAGVLSARLRAAGLDDDARVAALVAARGFLGDGDLRAATGQLGAAVRARPRGERITTRLHVREVSAAVARARGDERAADAQLRVGLQELHAYQASFGSLDLQTAVVRHGRALAEQGLAAAVRDGRPGRVFAWAERGRALASRLPPVRPPADPAAAAILQELRLVRLQSREAELSGRAVPALLARRRELEGQVRQRSWYAPGPGEVQQPARLRAVRSALAVGAGGAPGALVAHVVCGQVLHALVVTPRTARVVPLGARADVAEAIRRVRADLDVLALHGYPPALRVAATRSLRRGLARLDDLLWRPIGGPGTGPPGDGAVVLVPAGSLVGVPWPLLPGLAGRPVSVARSATAWLRSRRHLRAAARRPAGRVVLAAGPDLPRARQEVDAVAGVWPGAVRLTGPAATGAAVLAAANSADVLHVAAHGAHEPESPLFSAVRLADGPVFGYELAGRLGSDAHVVLSCCDLGIAAVRPGEEVLGMTAALLHAGAVSVVASVARVADDVAADTLVEYHRGLQAGRWPAAALAAAMPGPERGAGFVCFGAGW